MSKNLLKILVIFILGIGGGIFADQILWPYFVERPLFYQYRLEKNPIYLTEKKEITVQENIALQEAAEKAEKVVAGVRSKTSAGITLEGSGLIVTSDGLLVTLAELVPWGSNFSFFIDGKAVAFQILNRDLKENLALVKVGETNLATAGFADLEKLKMGERIFLVGSIFEDKVVKKAVNQGIVRTFDENLIQTNILEETNLQGSPLFNIGGRVVGLNTIDKKGRVSAIPASKIRQFLGF